MENIFNIEKYQYHLFAYYMDSKQDQSKVRSYISAMTFLAVLLTQYYSIRENFHAQEKSSLSLARHVICTIMLTKNFINILSGVAQWGGIPSLWPKVEK